MWVGRKVGYGAGQEGNGGSWRRVSLRSSGFFLVSERDVCRVHSLRFKKWFDGASHLNMVYDTPFLCGFREATDIRDTVGMCHIL